MGPEIEGTRARLSGRVDPRMLRGFAYLLTVCVLVTTRFLGGSWLTVFGGIFLVASAAYLLPVRDRSDRRGDGTSSLVSAIRSLPPSAGIIFVILVNVVAGVVAYPLGGVDVLGRGFNLFLLPIFLTSLFFGPRLAVFSWLVGVLASLYFIIPPELSFAIDTLEEFADLFIFLYLGIFVLAVPILLRAAAGVE